MTHDTFMFIKYAENDGVLHIHHAPVSILLTIKRISVSFSSVALINWSLVYVLLLLLLLCLMPGILLQKEGEKVLFPFFH